ncbi:MAG TPA: queuosine salvage family protein [Solirubrobacterales bacterium]|nr:queuosine salvage family protein [Solirubrobacterales bacterium]
MPESPASVSDQVRAACAWVAGRARSVTVDESAIEAYAGDLPAGIDPPEPDPATELVEGGAELRAAFVICLNAINFGSGWWPTIHKRPGHSGYFTIAAGVTERFREKGAWSVAELTGMEPAAIAEVVGQEPGHPLMTDFAASSYDGREAPFCKRPQLVPADLDRAGVATLRDQDRLTAFADNLVPHVLRVDGVLRLDPALAEAIDAGELLEHGSAEEVELRACAIHAVELLAAAVKHRLLPAEVDYVLWTRGGARRYKAIPRPRSRNTAY